MRQALITHSGIQVACAATWVRQTGALGEAICGLPYRASHPLGHYVTEMSTLKDLATSRGLYVRCPSCDESFSARDANLFDATKRLPSSAAKYIRLQKSAIAESLQAIADERKELGRRSSTSAESSGVGQIIEMLTPSLPGFPLSPSDCRALLKPVDYVGFKGLTATGKVDAVVFLEIKSGRQPLSPEQRQVKTAVTKGQVRLLVADHLRSPD